VRIGARACARPSQPDPGRSLASPASGDRAVPKRAALESRRSLTRLRFRPFGPGERGHQSTLAEHLPSSATPHAIAACELAADRRRGLDLKWCRRRLARGSVESRAPPRRDRHEASATAARSAWHPIGRVRRGAESRGPPLQMGRPAPPSFSTAPRRRPKGPIRSLETPRNSPAPTLRRWRQAEGGSPDPITSLNRQGADQVAVATACKGRPMLLKRWDKPMRLLAFSDVGACLHIPLPGWGTAG